MDDGSVVAGRDRRPRGSPASLPDGTQGDDRRVRRRPERRRRRARRRLLHLQQRRLRRARRARGHARSRAPSTRTTYLGRLDPARRPRHRRGHRPLHRVRRPPAAGAERPRVRHRRRLLVHRPRHPRRAARATCTGIYYAPARRLVDHGGRASRSTRRTASGCRPTARTVYWAETYTGRVVRVERRPGPAWSSATEPARPGGVPVPACPGCSCSTRSAVDGDGNVCVATLVNGGVTVISPDGEIVEHVPTGDPFTTNICFGGPDRRTAYITLSGTGGWCRRLAMPRPALAFTRRCARG